MKQWNKVILATALAVSASTAFADGTHGKRYGALGVGFLEADGNGLDASFNHIEGRLGGYMNDYLAFEGRAGVGVTGDDQDGVDIDLRYLLGLYAKVTAPVNDMIYPYAMVGFSRADIEVEGPGGKISEAETDASYGIGVDADLGGISVFAEYAQFAEIEGADLSGFTIGLRSSF